MRNLPFCTATWNRQTIIMARKNNEHKLKEILDKIFETKKDSFKLKKKKGKKNGRWTCFCNYCCNSCFVYGFIFGYWKLGVCILKRPVYLKHRTLKKVTQCKCPKCERIHKLRILWIGRGMPRKFCPLCKITVYKTGNIGATFGEL